MDIIEKQFIDLKRKHPQALLTPSGHGANLVTIPEFPLKGYGQSTSSLYFVTPVGYPFANPVDFFTDDTLRLKDGQLPELTSFQDIPYLNKVGLWFSHRLHQGYWDPNKDSLLTYVKSIKGDLSIRASTQLEN